MDALVRKAKKIFFLAVEMSVTTSVRVRSGNGRRKSGGSRTGGENGKPTQQHSYKKDARGDRMELPGNGETILLNFNV